MKIQNFSENLLKLEINALSTITGLNTNPSPYNKYNT